MEKSPNWTREYSDNSFFKHPVCPQKQNSGSDTFFFEKRKTYEHCLIFFRNLCPIRGDKVLQIDWQASDGFHRRPYLFRANFGFLCFHEFFSNTTNLGIGKIKQTGRRTNESFFPGKRERDDSETKMRTEAN